jgi:hypothetical protein
MLKRVTILAITLLLSATAFSQSVKLWEKTVGSYSWLANDNNSRGICYNKATGHLLVASRTGSANIHILDANTGVKLDSMKMTGVTGGTYLINIVRAADDGAIFTTNLTTDGKGFKIYRWANETAEPTVAFSGDVTARSGDIFSVTGSGVNTVIFASGSSNSKIEVFTTTDGISFTKGTAISLSASGLARGGISPVTTGASTDLWVNGAGTAVSHINSTGTLVNAVDGGVISTGWHSVKYWQATTGSKYIAVVGKNDTAEGTSVKIFDVTASEVFPKAFVSLKLSNKYNANTNATGDVDVIDNGNGTFKVFALISNNGLAAFKTNMLSIAQARIDANGDFKPDRLNDTVTVKGIVFTPNYQTAHRSYYIWDGTAGIATYKTGLLSPACELGDSVIVTGQILHYNGLTEIQLLNDSSLVVLGKNGILPTPITLTAKEFNQNGEKYEGSLIKVTNLSKASGTWPAANSSATLKVFSQADSLDLRIDSDTDIDGSTEPVWPKDIVGVLTQFSSASVSAGYQLQPRFQTDFLPPTIVPVELTSFSAISAGKSVVLNWVTATETNNKGFEVEKSSDGKTFAQVAFIRGAGTSAKANGYNYTDNAAASGKYYYRLKQVDFDGSFAYSKTVEVNVNAVPGSFELSQNYPNPFNPSTTISFSAAKNDVVTLKVFNSIGQEVASLFNGQVEAGKVYNVNFDAGKFTSGVYFYQLSQSGGSITKKMTLMK